MLDADDVVEATPNVVKSLAVSFTTSQPLQTEYEKLIDHGRSSLTSLKSATEATKSNLTVKERSYTALIDRFHAIASSLLDIQSYTTLPLHELFWFTADAPLTAAFTPNIRNALRSALLYPEQYLGITPVPHISTAYKLLTESTQQVNLHDWFEAFKVADDGSLAHFTHCMETLTFMGLLKDTRKTYL